jgi:hypothetical protein
MESGTNPQPNGIDLAQVEGAFSYEAGFSRPNWRLIDQAVQQRAKGPDELDAEFAEAARQWLNQLRADLGGDYRVKESPEFLLLSALSEEASCKLLTFAEQTLEQIRAQLRDNAWNCGYGKGVILLFAEEDDYYQYVSWFYRDGTHPANGGCLVNDGYSHIAAPYEPLSIQETLAHELMHNCLVHLPLPVWLNEGLAVRCQRSVSNERLPVLDAELKLRHLEFWNEQNIQEFWAGISWQKPGDAFELSYSLAEIMVILLSERAGDWAAFVKAASADDAGQTSALACLGVDLGDAMSTFLGEGNWRPRRKAMATLWEEWQRGDE